MSLLKVSVNLDDDAINPREDCNLCLMSLFVRNHTLPQEIEGLDTYDFVDYDEMEAELKRQFPVVVRVYGYLHGGLVFNTAPFACTWDSGTAGFAVMTEETMTEGGFDLDIAYKIIESEVDTYNKYINGMVYAYRIDKVSTCNMGCKHAECIEYVGGYYNDDEALAEGYKMANFLAERMEGCEVADLAELNY